MNLLRFLSTLELVRSKNEHIVVEALARKYKAGDEKALRTLIENYTPVLSARIYSFTKDRDSLNDLTQDCWASIISKLKDIEFNNGFEAWTYSIIRNKSVDWIRVQQKARKQKSAYKESHFTAESQSDQNSEALTVMRKAINTLPHTQKMILNLFYKENLTLEEIAQILDISKGTVKSRLFYAREQLKETINK